MKPSFSTLVAGLVVGSLTLLPTAAQEKSVRPGINKPFENPDLKDFIQKFEGESREIAAHAMQIVAACKLKPGMRVADVGAGTGLFTRKFAAAVGEKGKVFAVTLPRPFCATSKRPAGRARSRTSRRFCAISFRPGFPGVPLTWFSSAT